MMTRERCGRKRVVSLKVMSWNLKGLNTTKDLQLSGFLAKNPTQDSPETRQ
jgi:hypothetical protein